MRKTLLVRLGMAAGLLLVTALAGCTDFMKVWDDMKPKPKPEDAKPAHVPAYAAGTVREYAVYDSGGYVPLQGYGVVSGLGKNGSKEVPENLRDYLVQYMNKLGIGKAPSPVTAMMILQDLDTAIVRVAGALPFGAPVGTRFDIGVSALPATQTRSLQGGSLMTTEMVLYLGSEAPGGTTKPLADGVGEVFVNPFVDPNDDRDLVKWREGRVLGGGKVVFAPPVRLHLRQADFARADTMAKRINETFRGSPGAPDVANALNRSTVEITIPRAWRADYEHFLELVMHLPLAPAATWETRARELVRMLDAPDSGQEETTLVLEAMGRNTVPLLKPLFTSRNSGAAFYAARTAGRMGELSAEQVLLRFAGERNSPFRVPAIEELGRNDRFGGAVAALHPLVDDENNLVRIAAYEALVCRHDNTVVTSVPIGGGQLTLDLVKSNRSYVVYATQSHEARLALFGADMPIARSVFFSPPDDLITIRGVEIEANRSLSRRMSQWVDGGMTPGDAFYGALMMGAADPVNREAPDGGPCLSIFRKMPSGKYSGTVFCRPTVRALVTELASMPDRGIEGDIHGLRLNYAQVLSIIYRMCQRGDIPAKFSLQTDTSNLRIRAKGSAAGRPDVPES